MLLVLLACGPTDRDVAADDTAPVGNTAPRLTISSPSAGETVRAELSLTLTAEVGDAEDAASDLLV